MRELKWREEDAWRLAKQFEFKGDFIQKYPGLYWKATREWDWPAISAHMKSRKCVIKWCPSSSVEEARKYQTRTEFFRGSRGAYNYVKTNSLENEAFAHMKTVGNLVQRLVYWIKSESTREIYIGLTMDLDSRSHAREDLVDLKKRGVYEAITGLISTGNAAMIERDLIRYYASHPDWMCLNRSNGGEVGHCLPSV